MNMVSLVHFMYNNIPKCILLFIFTKAFPGSAPDNFLKISQILNKRQLNKSLNLTGLFRGSLQIHCTTYKKGTLPSFSGNARASLTSFVANFMSFSLHIKYTVCPLQQIIGTETEKTVLQGPRMVPCITRHRRHGKT